MHVLLFILYGAIACYALPRLKFFRNSGIRPGFLLALFSLRVLTGCLHNWIAWRYYPHHGDIWTFFQASFTTREEVRAGLDRKSTRLNSSHFQVSRMPSSA